ncbi:hypothetical protein OIE71_18255 [Streptomyces sp. NBC_01725]|uniref:hypothetical protein n=1 Tax=Streptomyces sp. NBC_01725 TaxID=2975923 RepID=UPI002E2E006A|nr:hypothetical protein [Streptomyces sp. NBC_01725]
MRTTTYETADGWEYGRDVWVMDVADRQVHQISTARNVRSTPVDWSLDGQHIVYVTENGLNAGRGAGWCPRPGPVRPQIEPQAGAPGDT